MQSCFHLDLALKLKGINIEKGGRGKEGCCDFSFVVVIGFYEEEVKFRLNVSNFLQLLVEGII